MKVSFNQSDKTTVIDVLLPSLVVPSKPLTILVEETTNKRCLQIPIGTRINWIIVQLNPVVTQQSGPGNSLYNSRISQTDFACFILVDIQPSQRVSSVPDAERARYITRINSQVRLKANATANSPPRVQYGRHLPITRSNNKSEQSPIVDLIADHRATRKLILQWLWAQHSEGLYRIQNTTWS